MLAKCAQLKKQLKEEMELMESRYLIHSKIIEIRVGSKLFTTHLSTLQSFPDSFLCSVFSGKFNLEKDSGGAYFLDRNPDTFSIILDYLRNHHDLEYIKTILPSPGTPLWNSLLAGLLSSYTCITILFIMCRILYICILSYALLSIFKYNVCNMMYSNNDCM